MLVCESEMFDEDACMFTHTQVVCKRPREGEAACEAPLPQPVLTDFSHFDALFKLEPVPRVTTRQLLREAVFAGSVIFGGEEDVSDWARSRSKFVIPDEPVGEDERKVYASTQQIKGNHALYQHFLNDMDVRQIAVHGEPTLKQDLEMVRARITFVTFEQFMSEPREALDAYVAWFAQQPISSSVATYAQRNAPPCEPVPKKRTAFAVAPGNAKHMVVIDLTGDD
jgi:hypothetical protein